MKKYTLILLTLISFTANSQIVNKFRDSTWFAKGVRFDSEIYLTKGASNGKVLTSNAFGCATWQNASGGVSQTTLNDSITAVRSIRKVDTIYRNLDSIIFKINICVLFVLSAWWRDWVYPAGLKLTMPFPAFGLGL